MSAAQKIPENTVESLTAEDILRIPADAPERLFASSDPDDIKSVFRALAKKWHPDVNKAPNVRDVFTRVTQLHEAAERKRERGLWQKPGELALTTTAGKNIKIKFLKKREFELGEMYVSNNLVTFMVRKEFSDLFENGLRRIRGISYANDGMREKTARTLPEIHKVMETPTHHVLTLRKTPDMVLAADLLEYCGGKVPPPHVAWMTSRLHNLECYLEWAGTVHNAISPETCFVSPENHSVALLGGWWYATPQGQQVKGLPKQAVAYAPRAVLERGLADKRMDASLIRATCRQLLGDGTGVRLARDPDIPRPMADWVCLPGSGNAVQDYKTWIDQVVLDSFGERRFRTFNVSPRDVYKPQCKGA